MRLFPLKMAAPTSQATNPHSLPEHSHYKSIPYEECLEEQIHGRLLGLDFPAFALCLCRLLQALGYQDVHLSGRREWKGYNKPGGGGYDLEATLPGPVLPGSLSPRRVIAQVKQFDGLRVHQRSVDELRGTCLRLGAAEAMLITTSAFSKVVRAGAAAPGGASSPIAPVRLMDGDELIALLIRYRLGVKECKTSTVKNKTSTVRKLVDRKLANKQWEIDDAFFAELALASAILSKASSAKRQNPTLAQTPKLMQERMQWRVTVRISSNPEAQLQKQKGGA